jgi:hypothetical protein
MPATKAVTKPRTVRGIKMSNLIASVEVLGQAIDKNHPELKKGETIYVVQSSPRMTKLGHFAPGRWKTMSANGKGDRDVHEVALVAEFLDRKAAGAAGDDNVAFDLAEVVLHEAAHALAHVRGVKTTSGGGRYHNSAYLGVAEEIGLAVSKTASYGYSQTALLSETKTKYRKEIAGIKKALRMYRKADPKGHGKKTDRNYVSCSCSCGRTIRMSKTTLAEGDIYCGQCQQEFGAEN